MYAYIHVKQVLHYERIYVTILTADKRESIFQVVRLNLGKSAKFTCNSNGNSFWYFERSKLYPVTSPIMPQKKWNMDKLQWKDAGHYFCYGSNDNGLTHFMSRLDVRIFCKFISFN